MRTTRQRILTTTVGAGVLVAVLGAVALACTVHIGEMWFCDDETANSGSGVSRCSRPSDYDDPTKSVFTKTTTDTTFFSNAVDVPIGTEFYLKYIDLSLFAGVTQAGVSMTTCHAGPHFFEDASTGDRAKVTSTSVLGIGVWDDYEVTMPDAGTYMACAVPTVPGNAKEAGQAPQHVAFTIQ